MTKTFDCDCVHTPIARAARQGNFHCPVLQGANPVIAHAHTHTHTHTHAQTHTHTDLHQKTEIFGSESLIGIYRNLASQNGDLPLSPSLYPSLPLSPSLYPSLSPSSTEDGRMRLQVTFFTRSAFIPFSPISEFSVRQVYSVKCPYGEASVSSSVGRSRHQWPALLEPLSLARGRQCAQARKKAVRPRAREAREEDTTALPVGEDARVFYFEKENTFF